MQAQHQSGIIVVDKPPGISSAKVVAEVKRLLNAKKVGHAGTLDPFAEGVLVCCINDATRLARFLLAGNKTYDATLKLGIETDTQDS
ncbi:MAG: tRNA pseudouridine(55) synthase TruB, partial [Desulfobacterales bacterium]